MVGIKKYRYIASKVRDKLTSFTKEYDSLYGDVQKLLGESFANKKPQQEQLNEKRGLTIKLEDLESKVIGKKGKTSGVKRQKK